MTAQAGRRVLITGLSSYWGGRLAQALETDPAIEAIVGVDSTDPTRELERTEFVRVGNEHALLRRVVDAAEIDTVIDTRLTVDSATAPARATHENNVIGTMNILAACGHAGSPVRKLVFKSSTHYYGAEQDDPAFFTEAMARPHPAKTPIERDIVEAEGAVADFGDKNPSISVTTLRFANVLGPDVRTSHVALFSLPAVPMILGFDPRYQFVHEDDVVAALAHATEHDLPGVFNVAADGVLAFSETVSLLGKRYLPVLPPWGTGLASTALRRMGLNIPPEMLNQLRFGRGVDNRKLKSTQFKYRYTTRETVIKLAEHMRLKPVLRGIKEPYRYEREVEEFVRWSPNVRDPKRRAVSGASSARGRLMQPTQQHDKPGNATRTQNTTASRRSVRSPVEGYDDLNAEQVLSLLGSLKRAELEAVREYELAVHGREQVVSALDGILSQEGSKSQTERLSNEE